MTETVQLSLTSKNGFDPIETFKLTSSFSLNLSEFMLQSTIQRYFNIRITSILVVLVDKTGNPLLSDEFITRFTIQFPTEFTDSYSEGIPHKFIAKRFVCTSKYDRQRPCK